MSNLKLIVEIEDIYVHNSPNIHDTPKHMYKIKGFDSILLDESDLCKFQSLQDYKINLLTDIMGHFTKEK